jgi:hypothetical protein
MKRLLVAVAAVGLLVLGSATAVLAAPYEADDTPQAGWTCPGWSGSFGSYDPATNPTLGRIAEKLGVSATDLSKEMQAGKSVAEVAREKNVDLQAVVDLLVAPQKDMLAIRVKYGFLTQEQADLAARNMAEVTRTRLEARGFFGGMMGGGMMGRGGMMGSGTMGPGMMGGPGPRTAGPDAGHNWGPGMMGRGGMMGGWGFQNRDN